MRRLTVLSVAYSFAPAGPDAVGGAEQILSALDRALVGAGHTSFVVACRGSQAVGELIDTGVDPTSARDEAGRATATAATRACVQAVLSRRRVDVLHMHGLDFAATLPDRRPPTLVTLHLPPSWYPSLADRPDVWMHCVSAAQERACPAAPGLLACIPNGVPVAELASARHARRGYALMLGRVCPEKGQHLALRAARMADMTLLIGGCVFPYPAHQAYFAQHVAPMLDRRRRFLGPVGFARKRRLLAAASCVLLPSLAPETSSLVAMEALACGTPVIAYPSGALADLIETGRTGFLVDDVAAMAEAMGRLGEIASAECRSIAHARFSEDGMAAAYLDRYQHLAAADRRAAA